MENSLDFYKKCIKIFLTNYEKLKTKWSEVELLFDDERMRYIALRIGWQKYRRIHFCLIQIDICEDKIIIQANNTEDMVATELAAMGIPRDKIYLGFIPQEVVGNGER